MKSITVGLISPESTAPLRSAVMATDAAAIVSELKEYCLELRGPTS
jgi:hypothetical protein